MIDHGADASLSMISLARILMPSLSDGKKGNKASVFVFGKDFLDLIDDLFRVDTSL